MAKTRWHKSPIYLRQRQARTTWTRFRLPISRDWIDWPAEYPDRDLGPLADVPGRVIVRLGRKVLDPESAALIVLWESAEALNAFRASRSCAVVLQTLGCEDDPLSGLQYEYGFAIGERRMGDQLHGRMILDVLNVEGPHKEGLDSIKNSFEGWVPEGCESLHQRPFYSRHAYAWMDVDGATSTGSVVWYHFFRWNDSYRFTAEREIMAAGERATHESWAARVARIMPPVVSWTQERWDIRLASCDMPEAESEEEVGNVGGDNAGEGGVQ